MRMGSAGFEGKMRMLIRDGIRITCLVLRTLLLTQCGGDLSRPHRERESIVVIGPIDRRDECAGAQCVLCA